ncbi:MAG: SCO family protein [Armatimonadota bacterium]
MNRARGLVCGLLLSSLVGVVEAQAIPPDKERTFDTLVPNVRLIDSKGRMFYLHTLRGKPVILSPIYTGCPSACIAITRSLKRVIPQVGTPGKDFWVLSLTFNPKERAQAIRNYQRAYQIDGEGWRVVYAATEQELFQLLDALDFRFRYVNERVYDHPNLLVFLSPDLRIRYYAEGTEYTVDQIRTGLRWAHGEWSLWERLERALLPIGIAVLIGGTVLSFWWGWRRPRSLPAE